MPTPHDDEAAQEALAFMLICDKYWLQFEPAFDIDEILLFFNLARKVALDQRNNPDVRMVALKLYRKAKMAFNRKLDALIDEQLATLMAPIPTTGNEPDETA